MDKKEFLNRLESLLVGLSADKINESLAFYAELIDDRIEEGIPEARAVAAVGPRIP